MATPFDDLALKPGAQWLDGKWVKSLLKAIRSDRAVPGAASGITELPSSSGRLLSVGEGKPIRICMGGVAQDVPFRGAPAGLDFAHLPFFPEQRADLTAGSFVASAITEDRFMSHIWRLREWEFYGVLYRTRREDGVTIQAWTAEPGNVLRNGESNVFLSETDPFVDLDDILSQWRISRTTSNGTAEPTGQAGLDFWWGPRGAYDLNGGVLDSEILFTSTTGDENFYLGSQQYRTVEFGVSLTQVSNVDFVFDPDGINAAIPLYFFPGFPDSATGTTAWGGTLRMKPGPSYWPWVINGDDTWNILTGEKLRDPRRTDSNGSPLIYFCQQE